jgi:hypothetical protein
MRYIWQEFVHRNYAGCKAFMSYLMGARMRIVHIRSILPALLLSLALPLAAHAQVGIGLSVTIAPPEIPVYEQPAIPDDGYIWTPGFWQWGPDGYFWVPGTWVEPPSVGLLWTPGYWGWGEGAYLFHAGYWGPHVGFYGGVNYGYGYGGAGFEGGYWQGGHMYYNREVMNVGDVHVTNVYNKTVIVNNTTRVSFNGGAGGVRAQPTQTDLAAAHERHVEPTAMQTQHVHAASSNHELLATVNHGAPTIAATAKPGVFSGKGVVSANHAAPASAAHSPTAAQSASHAPAANQAAPARADRPATAMHSETHAPAANQGAPVTHAPTVTHAAPVSHAEMTHTPGRPPAASQAAPRPEVRAMPAAHPPAAAPPHPAAVAPPRPQVQQHAAPKGEPQGPPSREEKRN